MLVLIEFSWIESQQDLLHNPILDVLLSIVKNERHSLCTEKFMVLRREPIAFILLLRLCVQSNTIITEPTHVRENTPTGDTKCMICAEVSVSVRENLEALIQLNIVSILENDIIPTLWL